MKNIITILAIALFATTAQAQSTTFTLPVKGTVAGQADGFVPMVALYDFDQDAIVAPILGEQWVSEDVTFTIAPTDAAFAAFAAGIAQPQYLLSTGHTIQGIQKSAAAQLNACFDADLQTQAIRAIHVQYSDVRLTTQADHTAFSYTLTITLDLADDTTAMSK